MYKYFIILLTKYISIQSLLTIFSLPFKWEFLIQSSMLHLLKRILVQEFIVNDVLSFTSLDYLSIHQTQFHFSNSTQFQLVNCTSNSNSVFLTLFLPNTFYHEQVLRLPNWIQSWVHPHVRVYFVIIKAMFIFHCPVGTLKRMYLFSSTQQGSDPVFTFTSLLGTKPLTYGKFTKDLKWLLKHLGLETGYSNHSFRRGGERFAPDWHSR